jgi:hypothetical protein
MSQYISDADLTTETLEFNADLEIENQFFFASSNPKNFETYSDEIDGDEYSSLGCTVELHFDTYD